MALVANEPFPSNSLQSSLHPIDEEDDVILDDDILGSASGAMATAQYGQHRDTFANTAFLSSNESPWPNLFSGNDIAAFNQFPAQANLLPDQRRAQFPQTDSPQFSDNAVHTTSWQLQNSQAANATGGHNNNAFPSDLDTRVGEPSIWAGPQQLMDSAPHGLPVATAPDYQQYANSTASPQSENGWLSTSSVEHPERQPKLERSSPSFRRFDYAHLRRDGVRKKNARFEIPEERNIHNIDELIRRTDPNQEDLVKELKAQKRLLRNRQAALDSRYRKKQHTENLEKEKKHYETMIDGLGEEINATRMHQAHWAHERQQWQQWMEDATMEKEELVRRHTLETTDLRKKNAFLTEELQRRDGLPISALPSSAGFSSTFSDFDHLAIDGSPSWDEFSFLSNPGMDTEPPKQDNPLALRPKQEDSPAKDDGKSATSGLLLMLLLCGAWVAANTGPTAPVTIPQMPEDVRVASAAVLDNIYRDAGLEPQHPSPKTNSPHSMPNLSWNNQQNTFNSADDPFHQLTAPTHQQRTDQLFSLTPNQYNHITSDGLFASSDSKPASPPARRRNLAEALAAMRAKNQGPAADVYTRSLMWDEVPANVVRDFARMVAESNQYSQQYGANGEPIS